MNDHRKFRICLLTTIDTNVGDDWIREGLCYLIMRSCNNPIDFELINIHDWKGSIIDDNGNDKILSADAIIMAGTPFYFINERKDLIRKGAKLIFSLFGLVTGYSKYDGRCSGAPHVKPLWYDRIKKCYPKKPVAILAAGTNLNYYSNASELMRDRFIQNFLKDIHSWSRLNTVREPLASSLLRQMQIEHYQFPCTAFWAMDNASIKPYKNPEVVVFNYMPSGGHYRFEQRIGKKWESAVMELYQDCVKYYGKHRIRFICHDSKEADEAVKLIGSKNVYYEKGSIKTIELYRYARTGVVNRCHALMAMAGFGSPGLVVGKDSRTLMATEIGLPRYYYEKVNSEDLFTEIKLMYDGFEGHNGRLKKLKHEKEMDYVDLIKEKFIQSIDSVNSAAPC
jgi:hypothetical protein